MANNKVSISDGLDALFFAKKANNDNLDKVVTDQPDKKEDKFTDSADNSTSIPIAFIAPSDYQPRTQFEDIKNLIDSIRENGILQPLLIRTKGKNQYELIAGERRLRAAKSLGLIQVPVYIKNVNDDVAAAFALIENIQRKQLSYLDEAKGYKTLLEKFKLTHEIVAKKVGRSRSSITNTLRLLELNEYTKEYLEAGHLEMGHARALLSLTADEQIEAVNKIIDGKLNVRQTEQLVQRIKNPIIKTPMVLRADDRMLLESWRQRLLPHASQVKVKMDAHDNISVNIKCSSPEEAEKLINEIEKLKSQRTTKG